MIRLVASRPKNYGSIPSKGKWFLCSPKTSRQALGPKKPHIVTTGVPHRSRLEDFRGSQFSDKNDRDGPSNVRFLAIQPLDAICSPRIFY
jgi:hypothetical protein